MGLRPKPHPVLVTFDLTQLLQAADSFFRICDPSDLLRKAWGPFFIMKCNTKRRIIRFYNQRLIIFLPDQFSPETERLPI